MRKEDRLTKSQSLTVSSLLASVFMQSEQEVQNFDLSMWNTMFDTMVNDETIADASEKLASIIVANIVNYQHSSQEIEDFVNENLKTMEDSLISVLQTAAEDMNNYGFHVSEIVYRYDEKSKKLMFKKFARIPPSNVRFNVNKKGDIVSATVYGSKQIRLLPDKMFIAINKKQNGLYGEPNLKKAYRWWKVKKHLVEFWAIALEKYAVPPLVAKTAKPNQDDVLTALSTLYSNGAMVINPEDEVSTIEGRRDFPELFDRALKMLNVMLYRAYLLPALLGDVQTTGSYALGKIQLEPFYTSTRIAAESLASQFVNTAVKYLLEINGFQTNDYGRFVVINEPSSEEKWRIGQLVYQLTNVGYLSPEEDDEWVRAMLRFAQKKQSNSK